MLSREIIEKTEVFLKRKFDAADYLNAHPEAKAYRIEHTYRVANIGRELALKEGFDETEMVIACLLHDVSYCEEFGEKGWIEHGRRAAHIARPFLSELGLAEDRINDIWNDRRAFHISSAVFVPIGSSISLCNLARCFLQYSSFWSIPMEEKPS